MGARTLHQSLNINLENSSENTDTIKLRTLTEEGEKKRHMVNIR